ncbi:hypothetical protein HY251_08610 [bacterium]|nr:hypothetical protein [bacterium]
MDERRLAPGTKLGLLEDVKIATPCSASWDSMKGDARVRSCGLCRLNVYNLSGMSREAGEALVRGKEGRLCVRLFQRADGTVLTQDCPEGFSALARRKLAVSLLSVTAVASAIAVSLVGFVLGKNDATDPSRPGRYPWPLMGASTVDEKPKPPRATPPARPAPPGCWVMGEVEPPPQQRKPQQGKPQQGKPQQGSVPPQQGGN